MLDWLTWQAGLACGLSFVAGALAMRQLFLWAQREDEQDAEGEEDEGEEEAPPAPAPVPVPWKCPDCKRAHDPADQGKWKCRFAENMDEMHKRGLDPTEGYAAESPEKTSEYGALIVEAGFVCVRGVKDKDGKHAWFAPAWLVQGTIRLVDLGLPRERIVAVLKQGRQAVEAEIAAQTLSRTP